MKILNTIGKIACMVVVIFQITKGNMTAAGVWFCVAILWDIQNYLERNE